MRWTEPLVLCWPDECGTSCLPCVAEPLGHTRYNVLMVVVHPSGTCELPTVSVQPKEEEDSSTWRRRVDKWLGNSPISQLMLNLYSPVALWKCRQHMWLAYGENSWRRSYKKMFKSKLSFKEGLTSFLSFPPSPTPLF